LKGFSVGAKIIIIFFFSSPPHFLMPCVFSSFVNPRDGNKNNENSIVLKAETKNNTFKMKKNKLSFSFFYYLSPFFANGIK
jgi:hypothetical protein